MKAVIIGGGIAGLTLGILLKKKKWEISINERSLGNVSGGHAFLMSIEGYSIISGLFKEAKNELKKETVNQFNLRNPLGDTLVDMELEDWFSMKRTDLIAFLTQFFVPNEVKKGRVFSHFLYENHKAIAAVFDNGDIEHGDLFVGADGSNSKVREFVHGSVEFTPVHVKEIVGMSKRNPTNLDLENCCFKKIQSQEKGLAIGYIPTSKEEVVWFMQYDVQLEVGKDLSNPEKLNLFCNDLLKDFPSDIAYLITQNDYSKTYIWNTRDFDLLPRFHKNNVVLIGDAAHLALPFTSAGTTNAIIDAQILSNNLGKFDHFEEAFVSFYNLRSPSLKRHLERGRELKQLFLHPEKTGKREFLLPLVSDETQNYETISRKKITITYFTDPICSTCWIIQPSIRKLTLEYGEYIEMNYHMGGLLPSWKTYDAGRIKNAKDAAEHWEEVSECYKIPINADVWINDPLDSSFPPSIAFKAAQMQDNDKAISFLRRIKEMVFVEKQNIEKWEVLETAAIECDLDIEKLRADIQGEAPNHFKKDLELAKALNINSFPTLIFSIDGENKEIIKGYQSFEKISSTIQQLLPEIRVEQKLHDPEKLFKRFNNMTEDEFSFLSNHEPEASNKIISKLISEKKLVKINHKNGVILQYIKTDSNEK